jgi:hypothetical protein
LQILIFGKFGTSLESILFYSRIIVSFQPLAAGKAKQYIWVLPEAIKKPKKHR